GTAAPRPPPGAVVRFRALVAVAAFARAALSRHCRQGNQPRQGDKEKRRQGERAGRKFSLSPCLLVSLSSCRILRTVGSRCSARTTARHCRTMGLAAPAPLGGRLPRPARTRAGCAKVV